MRNSSAKRMLVGGTIAALVLAGSAAAQRQPEAEAVARRMMDAMGGPGRWHSARFVRFDFVVKAGGQTRVDRNHLWDKQTGQYRYEHTRRDGKREVVLFNINDQSGSVFVDGTKLASAEAAEPLKEAYGAFINDMYWLAMPWKWLDPGVNLRYLGEQQKDGKAYEVVELTFNNVGLTPGDTYRGFVDKVSNLMTYWEYTLQSGNKGAWNWEYGDYGGVKLAKNHSNAEGTSINMGQVAVLNEVDGAYFTDPGRVLSGLK